MKKTILIASLMMMSCSQKPIQLSEKTAEKVEVSCGKCNFGMKSDDCKLAIKKEGATAFVSNKKCEDYGDPHEKDGLCMVVKKAIVKGKKMKNEVEITSLEWVK